MMNNQTSPIYHSEMLSCAIRDDAYPYRQHQGGASFVVTKVEPGYVKSSSQQTPPVVGHDEGLLEQARALLHVQSGKYHERIAKILEELMDVSQRLKPTACSLDDLVGAQLIVKAPGRNDSSYKVTLKGIRSTSQR